MCAVPDTAVPVTPRFIEYVNSVFPVVFGCSSMPAQWPLNPVSGAVESDPQLETKTNSARPAIQRRWWFRIEVTVLGAR